MSVKSVLSWSLATALLGAASVGHAETAPKTSDFIVQTDVTAVSANGSHSLKWDARRGRWGMTLNLDQPAERSALWSDVQAGAYYALVALWPWAISRSCRSIRRPNPGIAHPGCVSRPRLSSKS